MKEAFAMTEYKKQLTPEEETKPYAKYFNKPPAAPAQADMAAMWNPMNPFMALPIEQIGNLLEPGYLPIESGWCVLPNGTGYIANHVKMPGVTIDMINWWFAWHGLEDLRYKIWWPDGCFAASVSDIDRKKILDPSYSIHDKTWGRTHHLVKDIGPGPDYIACSYLRPAEDIGIDMSKFDPKTMTIMAANGVALTVNPQGLEDIHKKALFLCHFFREIPGGVEARGRFYIGCKYLDKVPYKILPPGIVIPEIASKAMGFHNVLEYANLASFLPELYAEQKGVIA